MSDWQPHGYERRPGADKPPVCAGPWPQDDHRCMYVVKRETLADGSTQLTHCSAHFRAPKNAGEVVRTYCPKHRALATKERDRAKEAKRRAKGRAA